MGQLYPGAVYVLASSGGGSSSTYSQRQSYTMSPVADGVATVFTVQGTVPSPIPQYIDVYVNGVFQSVGTFYDLDTTGPQFVVTFLAAPFANDDLEAVY